MPRELAQHRLYVATRTPNRHFDSSSVDESLVNRFNLILMKLISFLKLGENRHSPRVWIESRRLNSLGFTPGVGFTVEPRLNGVRLRPALSAENHVSKRISARQERPIIDIANRLLLSPLDGFAEIKVTAAFRQIDVVPSARGRSEEHTSELQ